MASVPIKKSNSASSTASTKRRPKTAASEPAPQNPLTTRDGNIRKIAPGSGRIPKAVKYSEIIALTEDKMSKRLPEIAEALIDMALGHYRLETRAEVQFRLSTSGGPSNAQRVYLEPPNLKAAMYCMDRIAGKPTDQKPTDPNEGSRPQINIYIPDNGRTFVDARGQKVGAIDQQFANAEAPRVLDGGSIYDDQNLNNHEETPEEEVEDEEETGNRVESPYTASPRPIDL